jgi:hypothetical protein
MALTDISIRAVKPRARLFKLSDGGGHNDSVRRAYARADFWEERVRMMVWWAESVRK